ncbi:tetratricopeptide repeat protein, partial [Odoribacter sp. OttesenSCG-928-J03]|nr:tetratricopeptide repeat protein [Odoribacter sp. OttesenSCG-928-J03]
AYSVMEKDLEACLTYTREIVQLAESSAEPDAARYYSITAQIYLACNVYDLAYEYFLKSLRLFEKFSYKKEICITNSNIGGVYLKLSQFEEALMYFKRGLDNAEELAGNGDQYLKENMCAFYNNVGLTYGKLGKSNVAITYLEKAIELTPAHLPKLLARYYANIAPLYYEIGERSKAFDCAGRCKKFWQEEKNDSWLAHCDYLIASFYFKENKLKRAEQLLDTALYYANRTTSKTYLRDIYELYVTVFKAQENYKQANHYLELLYDVEESLVNDNILSKVTTLKLEYDFDKKIAKQALEIQQTKYRYYLFLTISGMLLIIFVLLYFLVYFRMKQVKLAKKELERDLESRNKELTTNVMYLMKNADLIKEIIIRLTNLESNLKPENLKPVKAVIHDLQTLTRNDLWDEFEVRFNRVHIDFYKNLQEKFSDLSPTELKLCAFLRLNMSSKEISSLTGITPKSVDVMRARIRKKLNIANTDLNLVTFLAEF